MNAAPWGTVSSNGDRLGDDAARRPAARGPVPGPRRAPEGRRLANGRRCIGRPPRPTCSRAPAHADAAAHRVATALISSALIDGRLRAAPARRAVPLPRRSSPLRRTPLASGGGVEAPLTEATQWTTLEIKFSKEDFRDPMTRVEYLRTRTRSSASSASAPAGSPAARWCGCSSRRARGSRRRRSGSTCSSGCCPAAAGSAARASTPARPGSTRCRSCAASRSSSG